MLKIIEIDLMDGRGAVSVAVERADADRLNDFLGDCRRAIEREICDEWRAIDTASKDGERILLAIDHGEWGDKIWTGLWADGWMVSYGKAMNEPTHWMSLPKPPQE